MVKRDRKNVSRECNQGLCEQWHTAGLHSNKRNGGSFVATFTIQKQRLIGFTNSRPGSIRCACL